MKNIYKTLFFVPFLALTSCGSPKISEEEGQARLAGIAEKQAEEGFEFPTEFAINQVQKYEMKATLNDEVDEDAESLTAEIILSVKKQFYKISMISKQGVGDKEETSGYTVYGFIKDGNYYSCIESGETKVMHVTEITDENRESAEANITDAAETFQSSFGTIDFADAVEDFMADTDFTSVKGYTYYSTGEGNLTIKAECEADSSKLEAMSKVKKFTVKASAEVKYDKYLFSSLNMSIKGDIAYESEDLGLKASGKIDFETKMTVSYSPKVVYPNLADFEEAAK